MKTWLFVAFIAALTVAIVTGEPSGWGGYFQYANVPGWGQYEFGYNRGNHDHFTSRFEQGWGWKFKTKVRWGDKKGGYGEMYYDYQHSPKKGGWSHSGHHGKHHHVGSYSENIPTVLKPNLQALSSNPQPILTIPPPQQQSQASIIPPTTQRLASRTLMVNPHYERMGRAYPVPSMYYNPYHQMRY